jgi:hypothetical protein
MPTPYLLSTSSVVPAPPDTAFQTLLDAPLAELFPTRSLLIPPIRGCEGQQGAWGEVGQTRTVVLADGSRNLETLTAVERPTDYRYLLTDFTGPMKLLVRKVEGRFAFEAHGADTLVTWSWAVHPKHPLARVLLPAVGASWRAMARAMWPRFAARTTA